MDQPVLAARVREEKGKGAAKRLRRANQMPAVFYGPQTESVMLSVDYPELQHILKQGNVENVVIDLQLESDQGTETKKVMIKDLMIDPVKDVCLHADFLEISMEKEVTVEIPIHLKNTPKGVVNGGILQHVRRELSVSCLPDKLVNVFEVDVAELDIGDSLHVSDIVLPEGIHLLDDDHLTVATVSAPAVVQEEVAEEEEMEEEMAAPEEGEEKAEPEEKKTEEA
jgi:large subunit ribosomal protein L25